MKMTKHLFKRRQKMCYLSRTSDDASDGDELSDAIKHSHPRYQFCLMLS